MNCQVCFDELGDNRKDLDCGHSFCKTCVHQIIKINVRAFEPMKLRCPNQKCLKQLSKTVILSVLSESKDKPTERVFKQLQKAQLLLKDRTLTECPKCEEIGKKPKSVTVNCRKCAYVYCSNCSQKDHKGTQCKSAESDFGELKESRKLLCCPNCNVNIEKIDGCNQMRCPLCRTEFCWLCGREKGKYHFMVWNPLGCPGQALKVNHKIGYFALSWLIVASTVLLLTGLLWLMSRVPSLCKLVVKIAVLDTLLYLLRRFLRLQLTDTQYLLLHSVNLLCLGHFWTTVGFEE